MQDILYDYTDECNDVGLPLVVDHDRRLFQVSPLLERAKPGPDRSDLACARVAAGGEGPGDEGAGNRNFCRSRSRGPSRQAICARARLAAANGPRREGKRGRQAQAGSPTRATGLLVALGRGRCFPLADASRFGDGAAAAPGTQSLGQRSDVRVRRDAGLPDVERHQPPTERSRGSGPAPRRARRSCAETARAREENAETIEILKQRGPGYPLFHVFSSESDSRSSGPRPLSPTSPSCWGWS